MEQERLYLMALHMVPGIGDILFKQLISYCGSATEVFRQQKKKLQAIPGIGSKAADAIHNGYTFKQAERELKIAEEKDAQVLFYNDKAYPSRLKIFDDAPVLIYVQGNINLNPHRTVGIVGTRKSTAYGKILVEQLVEDLLPLQPLIISGLAYGIDIIAHKQALKIGLPTIGILGSGLDVIYPSSHFETSRKMINTGALITENHFGTQPDAHNFPARNRIIAGLCDALVVAEAAETGGALITAEFANSYNKDVFAFPGNIGQTSSEGCNKLIKTHRANLLTSAKDLCYIMNWSAQDEPRNSQLSLDLLSPEESKIVKILHEKKAPMMIDELTLRTGMSHSALASLLLSLEFSNVVAALPGKCYQLR